MTDKFIRKIESLGPPERVDRRRDRYKNTTIFLQLGSYLRFTFSYMHDVNKIHIVGNISEAPIRGENDEVTFIVASSRTNMIYATLQRLKIRVKSNRSVAKCAITLRRLERVYVEGSLFVDEIGPYIVASDISRMDHTKTESGIRGLSPDLLVIDEMSTDAVTFPDMQKSDTFSDLP